MKDNDLLSFFECIWLTKNDATTVVKFQFHPHIVFNSNSNTRYRDMGGLYRGVPLYFQFHFQFINFDSISSSGIWIELQFQFWNWIDPTLHAMAWHWTGNKSLPKPVVTRICCYTVSQVKAPSASGDQRKQSSLEASIYNISIWL